MSEEYPSSIVAEDHLIWIGGLGETPSHVDSTGRMVSIQEPYGFWLVTRTQFGPVQVSVSNGDGPTEFDRSEWQAAEFDIELRVTEFAAVSLSGEGRSREFELAQPGLYHVTVLGAGLEDPSGPFRAASERYRVYFKHVDRAPRASRSIPDALQRLEREALPLQPVRPTAPSDADLQFRSFNVPVSVWQTTSSCLDDFSDVERVEGDQGDAAYAEELLVNGDLYVRRHPLSDAVTGWPPDNAVIDMSFGPSDIAFMQRALHGARDLYRALADHAGSDTQELAEMSSALRDVQYAIDFWDR